MGSKATTITTAIRLKNKGIKDLTTVKNLHLIPLFSRLQIVHLQNNKITLIPEEICVLVARAPRVIEFLQEVNLSHNRLTFLPEVFFQLINLRKLNVDYNLLQEFPKQLLSFYRLEELSLRHNMIKDLPWAMDRLKRLHVLHVDHNLIDFIPNPVGKLDIRDLQILPNPLDTLNDENVLIACHSGDLILALDYFLDQPIPEEYPFKEDIVLERNRKMEKRSKYTEDQLLLRKVVKTKMGLHALEAHMTKEHSNENLLFWKELSNFSNGFSSDLEITTEELISEAKKIFTKFIDESSEYTLNLPHDIKQNLTRIFMDPFVFPAGINQWVFKDAKKAILELISRDTFKRFKNSPEGVEVISIIQEKDRRQQCVLFK